MRGLLLVTVGAILLWLGFAVERKPAAGAEKAGVGQEAGPKLGSPEPKQPGLPQPGGDSEYDKGQGNQAPKGEFIEPAPVSRAEHVEPDRVVLAGSASEAPPSGEVFELHSPGGDGLELSRVLLESWIARDPAPLQAQLNGEDVDPGHKRLMRAFWQALVGDARPAEQVLEAQAEGPTATSAQLELLRAAREVQRGGVVPETIGRRDPLARAMRMVLLESATARAVDESRSADTARLVSQLMHAELDAPWAPHRRALLDWSRVLHVAQEQHRLHPQGAWPSYDAEVRPNQGLTHVRTAAIKANPGLKVCTGLIEEVNDLGRFIHPGQRLRIPTDEPNMLVDLDARIAIYRHGSEAVRAWEVGIGKEGHDTPVGMFVVGEKEVEPRYPHSSRGILPFGDTDNPLGTRWIAWHRDGNKTSYGFHGTLEPEGVGGRVSQGCIRMRNTDVEELFDLLPVGCQVIIQP